MPMVVCVAAGGRLDTSDTARVLEGGANEYEKDAMVAGGFDVHGPRAGKLGPADG